MMEKNKQNKLIKNIFLCEFHDKVGKQIIC